MGVLTDMVAKSTRRKKKQLGVLAYPVSALESWQQSTSQTFHFSVDGKKVTAEGVSLVINNFGNIGIPGVSFLPDISPFDEYLDVVVVQAQDVPSLVALAKTTLADKRTSQLLQRWRGKKIQVHLSEKTRIIHDDEKQEVKSFTAQTTKDKVYCLLPKGKE